MRKTVALVTLAVTATTTAHLTCDPTKEGIETCKAHFHVHHAHDQDHTDANHEHDENWTPFKGGFHNFDLKLLDDADESCESLSNTHGVMYNDDSCSSATCQAVDNPSCDDVVFEMPDNGLPHCDDPENTLFDALAFEISNPKSDCKASTSGICADLPGFFSQFDSSIVGAYCTDSYLVMWTHGLYKSGTASCANYIQHLADVPRPPGVPYKQNAKDDYEDQCVGRSAEPQLQVFKIPLTPASWMEDPPLWGNDFFPASTVGMVLDGLPLYPAIDNSYLTVWDACESSMCNAHVGMGFDLHHHGNPMAQTCFYQNGSSPWYSHEGDPHGMPIGMSSDGYMIYGQYQKHTQLSPALDDCGGHNHTVSNEWDQQEYHYHAYTSKGTGKDDGLYYFFQGPSGCWRGDVSELPNFYEQGDDYKVNYDSSKDCGITRRNDYEQLRLCSDSEAGMWYPGTETQPCNWFD